MLGFFIGEPPVTPSWVPMPDHLLHAAAPHFVRPTQERAPTPPHLTATVATRPP